MTKGWLAAAVLVMLSAATFDLQMLEHDPSGQKEAIGKHLAEARIGIYDQAGIGNALMQDALSHGGESAMQLAYRPYHKLAEAAAACDLGSKAITEKSLAGCYQAQLQVGADKDVHLWLSFSQKLKTLGSSSAGQEELLSLSPASRLEAPLG